MARVRVRLQGYFAKLMARKLIYSARLGETVINVEVRRVAVVLNAHPQICGFVTFFSHSPRSPFLPDTLRP